MADADTTQVVDDQHLGMSDEDFLNAAAPDVTAINTQVAPATPVEPVVAVVDAPAVAVVVVAEESPLNSDDAALIAAAKPGDEATGAAKVADSTADAAVTAVDTSDKPAVVVPADVAVANPADSTAVVNFQAEYEKLLKPFKANGRDVQVNSVDDAISLMQMGANYNKKMAGLKPSLKILKLLENNQLLDETKLSYLIDLDKRDPAAINKLIKDSGLNPMDLDAEKAGDYVPKTRSVDEREIDLDTVLDEIQGTPTYNRTLELVSKQWDGASKQVVAGQPQLLKVINDHMSSGIYDLINAEVDRERMFGRLDGVSDIEAYRKVGDAIQARGGFNSLGSSQGKPATPPVVVTPKPKVDDEALKDKRRAAGSTPVVATEPAKDFNPLAMSDADFSKAAVPRFN